MKILQITKKAPFPMKDGESIAVSTLSRGLAESGHEVVVLAMSSRKHPFDISNIPTELRSIIKYHSIFVDSNHTLLKFLLNLFQPLPYHVQRFQNKDFEKQLVHLLSTGEFDIIQLEGMALLRWISLVRKHSNARIVFRAHNVESEIWMRQSNAEKNWIKRRLLKHVALKTKRYEFQECEKVDAIIAISGRDLDAFKKASSLTTGFVVPAAMIPYKSCNDTNKMDLCYLGALDWMPNTEGLKWFILHVLPEIRKKIPEIPFHIAGRNSSEEFKKWLLSQPVHFAGEVPDANQYLCSHGLVVLPLLAGSGMRIKAIEAMSAGKCMVSTSIGMEGIDANDGIHYLSADNASTFAEKIITLIQQPELRLQISKAAKLYADSTFGYKAVSKKLESCYEHIINLYNVSN